MATGDVDILRGLLNNLISSEANQYRKAALSDCLALTHRTPAVRRAMRKYKTPKDEETRSAVKQMAADNPDMSENEIAGRFNMGQGGRVSEILSDTPTCPPDPELPLKEYKL